MVRQRDNSHRRPSARLVALALVTVACLWALVPSTSYASTVNFTITCDGAQETPPNGSPSVWTGTATMDTVANTLSITVTNTGPPLTSPETAAHIHGPAAPGVPAGIKFGLPLGSPKNAVWNFPESDQADIIADLMYVNIHTSAFPGGEVRGQIVRTPSCGDTVLDGGEQCDDGNNTNGDCCSATCQNEPDGQTCGPLGAECQSGFCVGANHYLCHQVKDLKVPAKFAAVPGITLVDQTTNQTCEAKKPFLLCNPVVKNGEPIGNPNLHYCCYKLKCGTKVKEQYDITDQFGILRLETKKAKFLCNPCDKALAP